jgi:hypothetical protein
MQCTSGSENWPRLRMRSSSPSPGRGPGSGVRGQRLSVLLARHRLQAPSFVLIRSAEPLIPQQQVALLLNNLPALRADLDEGCVVSLRREGYAFVRCPSNPTAIRPQR